MKKALVLFSLAVFFIVFSSGKDKSSDDSKGKRAHMAFEEVEYDFGQLEYNAPAIHKFQFKNTGKEVLVVTKVKSTCGCTTPSYTSEPVKKNKIGIVEVKYNSRIVGKFSKSVTVTSNADNSPIVLRIKGEVGKRPATAN